MILEPKTKAELLSVARRALETATLDGTPKGADPIRPGDRHGAFVSLHLADHSGIRGCVGCMNADRPLEEVVEEMTVAAATRDPRFAPVQQNELRGLSIEISVLEPVTPLSSPADIEIGTHGLLVVGRGHRGVLLPQVASERGWDKQTFIRQTCVKAGLPASAADDGDVEVFKFGACVFSESGPPSQWA